MRSAFAGRTWAVIALAVSLLFVNAALAIRNIQQLDDDARWVAQTHEVLDLTNDVLLTLIDAETGQRGFLVTTREEYLKPYHDALAHWDASMETLKEKAKDSPRQLERIKRVESMGIEQFALLKEGIDLRRQMTKISQVVKTANAAKQQMDDIRRVVDDMRSAEKEQLVERQERTDNAYTFAMVTELVTTVVGLFLTIGFVGATQRNIRIREKAAAAIRQQRELLHTTVASIGDGVISTDKEGKITLLNAVAQNLTGWSSEEAQGQPLEKVFNIVNEQTRQTGKNPVQHVLQTGAIAGLANHSVLVARNGTETPIDDSAAPIRNHHGNIIGVVMVFRDVTERRRAEKSLKEADQRKTEFLAMLAHELRNPLAPIRNALQIMRLHDRDGSALGPVRDMMDRQVGHLVRLVDDLIDVNRITRGNLELRKARITIGQAVDAALESTRPLVETARHDLAVSVPPEPLWLDGDLTRLAQVVSNLLSNAVKYTPEGGRIWLTVERDAGAIILRVRDNGMGIPTEMLSRIFDMFTQVDRTIKRAQGGLGIGLTLVRRLVQMHGGSVEVLSPGLDQGSEFVVRLPLAKDGPTSAKPDIESSEKPSLAPRRRILVVDDNVDSARSLGMLLELLGNEVQMAYDGPGALQEAQQFRPDVVLLDIGLPGMSGYDVAPKLKALPEMKNVFLVAQTGWGQEEDRRRSKEAGFDAHLVKPIDQAALQRLLADKV
jgi:PAS domain S-box-containing protein